MIREEGPGVAGRLRLRKKRGKATDEIIAIPVVPEDIPALDPPDHDVVERTGDIEAGLSWHGYEHTLEGLCCQLNN